MRFASFALALAATSALASAQTPIGPFSGQYQEGFEGPQVVFTPCMPAGVFGGTAQLCTINMTGGCLTATGWIFQCLINAHGGSWFFGSATEAVEYTFTNPATRFGGYFGTNSGSPDAAIDFYDAGNNLIGSSTAVFSGNCAWAWSGWQIPGNGASRIVVTGLNPFGGAFVDMDDMEVDYTPGGTTSYCTAGTSTAGCTPNLTATGNPNVAPSNTCEITANNVEGQKSGIIFYGLAQNAQAWCATGGSSFLCVKAPTQRTPTQSSGGTAGACDGSLVLDWNAYQLANPGALGNPWSAGDIADVQAWYRDPPSCKTTSLSDALEMTYQP
jgi:hypothetical protein